MIEKFKTEYLDDIMQIWLASNISAHNFIKSSYWKSMFDEVKKMIPQSEIYVYRDNVEILGFVGITDNYIDGIFTICRSSGIGKALIDYVKKLKGSLELNVYEKNKLAIKFYERESFKIVSKSTDESTGEAELFMVWNKNNFDTKNFEFINLAEYTEYSAAAAEWFSKKWNIPKEAYIESINDCIDKKTEIPRWYIVLYNSKIIAGAGIIENDFHERKYLSPNLCALYVEKDFRYHGIARYILDYARKDLKSLGYKKLYLITDHTEFYEKCGWNFMMYVKEDDGNDIRMYEADC